MPEYIIKDFNDKPLYVDPELVFPMLDYFCEDICNIIAEYRSKHLNLKIAKEISLIGYSKWCEVFAASFIAHLAIIDSDKVTSKGIEISHDVDIIKRNIDKWIEIACHKANSNLFNYVLEYFDEPIGFVQMDAIFFANKTGNKRVRIWLKVIKQEMYCSCNWTNKYKRLICYLIVKHQIK